MPQQFNVLCCCECSLFQVHPVKKANKWSCKVCGVKQSVKKVFGTGSSFDCRHHVQKLNMLKGEQENSNIGFGQQNPRSSALKKEFQPKEFIPEEFFDFDDLLVYGEEQSSVADVSSQEDRLDGKCKIAAPFTSGAEIEKIVNEKDSVIELPNQDTTHENMPKRRRTLSPCKDNAQGTPNSRTQNANYNDLIKDIDFDTW